MCYYCEGKHCVRDCKKFTKDKAKCKLKAADLAENAKTGSGRPLGKGNITVSKVSSVPESTYLEQLLGNLRISNSEPD